MAQRKIDYFGTFLDSMKREPGQSADPANEVLKALRGGGLPAKNLIPLVGDSVSRFINVSERLMSQGWVQKMNGDVFALTDKGREVAAVLE
jgi:predicted transcriptional regulator